MATRWVIPFMAAFCEEARIIDAPEGALGIALYFTGDAKQATVILIHGNDPETREMGFLIPCFVLNGINEQSSFASLPACMPVAPSVALFLPRPE
jgi:hypothetical protein